MRTTIDRAGRLVVPKPIRDRLGIPAGAEVDLDEHDGVIEIRLLAAAVRIAETETGPVIEPVEPLPVLSDDVVQMAIEATRR
jgi:AbrB family looped-hinge helix DNA binding protein